MILYLHGTSGASNYGSGTMQPNTCFKALSLRLEIGTDVLLIFIKDEVEFPNAFIFMKMVMCRTLPCLFQKFLP